MANELFNSMILSLVGMFWLLGCCVLSTVPHAQTHSRITKQYDTNNSMQKNVKKYIRSGERAHARTHTANTYRENVTIYIMALFTLFINSKRFLSLSLSPKAKMNRMNEWKRKNRYTVCCCWNISRQHGWSRCACNKRVSSTSRTQNPILMAVRIFVRIFLFFIFIFSLWFHVKFIGVSMSIKSIHTHTKFAV